MARTTLAALAALAASVGSAAGFMEDLPLRVLSITPAASDGGDDSMQISGKDALTVTFSRAVIALGSDFGPEGRDIPADKVPFTTSVDVPGRLRWVTTFTARFDPTDDWPKDLDFTLEVNPRLTSFDGTALADVPGARRFTTPGVSVWLNRVTSETASAATDGTWVPDITNGPLSGAKEVPPDGILTIGFTADVDPDLVAPGISLRDGDGEPLQADSPTIEVLPCEKSWDTKCISARVNGELDMNTKYKVVVAAGTHYNALCGPTATEFSFDISGLVPFQIPCVAPCRLLCSATQKKQNFHLLHIRRFLQGMEIPENQYRQQRPTYRLWNLWLRHGLKSTLSQLQRTISIDPPIDFTLSQLNKATVQMGGDFEPSTTYTITVAASARVTDGFDLPLQEGGSMFETHDEATFFVEAGSYNAADATFCAAAGFPEQWTALAQGTDQCLIGYRDRADGCEGHPPKYIDGFAVKLTDASIIGAIASLYNRQSNFPAEDAATAQASAPLTDELAEVSIETADLLTDSGVFVHSRWDSVQYSSSATNPQKTSALGSVTSIGATFVMSSQTQMTAWITEIASNADVSGAEVTVYQIANSYQCTPDQVTRITSATTGREGTVTLDLSSIPNSYNTLVAVVQHNEKLAFIRNLPRYRTYNNGGQPDAAVVTDRALYKPGDTVHVKAYVRDHSGENLEIPTGTYQLQMNWKHDGSPQTTVDVEFDTTYGTLSTDLTVPHDADFGVTQVEVYWTGNDRGNRRFLDGQGITIADPRPPTVHLDFGTQDDVKVVAPDGAAHLMLSTMTYTGAHVADSKVTVTWNVQQNWNYGNSNGEHVGLSALLSNTAQVSTTSADLPTSGHFDIITGADGTATEALTIDNFAQIARIGDTLNLDAEWVGPTREVVHESLALTISESEWEVAVITTSADPLPGFTFGLQINVREVVGHASILGTDVDVNLYAWDDDETVRMDNGAPVMPSDSLFHCTVSADGGASISCPLALPDVGKYALVGCAVDPTGRSVCSAAVLGQTREDWENNPLHTLNSAIAFVPNKQTYQVGETAALQFFNPYEAGARAMVRWGNKLSKQTAVQSFDSSGLQTVELRLGDECRGGCHVMIVLTAPMQPASLRMPVQVPTSPLFDWHAPQVTVAHHVLAVPSDENQLTVDVTVDDAVQRPGSAAGFTVTLRDPAGNPVAGQVAAFAVDSAFLDLKPHPMTDLATEFAVNMLDQQQVHAQSSLDDLSYA
eukprot:SAG31_NODE_1440_length_8331_cov_4.818270_5_plen_1231_part_01